MSNEYGTEADRILAYGKEVAEKVHRDFVGNDASKLRAFSRGFNSVDWDSPVFKPSGRWGTDLEPSPVTVKPLTFWERLVFLFTNKDPKRTWQN